MILQKAWLALAERVQFNFSIDQTGSEFNIE